MLTTRSVVSILPVAMMFLGAGGVSAQDYPNKPIRIITSQPGDGNDLRARLIAQGIAGPLGQPVIVENRSGTQYEIVAAALPDGHTLLLASDSFMLGPLLQKLSYDAVRDFLPVTMVGQAPNILVVHPSLPVPINSVKELIALAKAKPGVLTYATSTLGSSSHLAGTLFMSMTGVNMMQVPYKGASSGVIGVMGGETQMMIVSTGSSLPHIKSGKLRALGVTSLQPSAVAPGLPTVAASGVPGYELVATGMVVVPAKTPAAIINRLNQEIVRLLNQPTVKEKFLNIGTEAISSSPEELGNKIKSEIAKWGKVIKDAGFGTR